MLRSRSLMVSRDAGLVWYLWLVVVVAAIKYLPPSAAPAAPRNPAGTPKVGTDSLNLSLSDQISAIREHPDGSVGIDVHVTAYKPGSGPSTVAAADTWSWRADMDEDSKRIAKTHRINPDTRKPSDLRYIRLLKQTEEANRSRAADILHDCNVKLQTTEAKVKKAEITVKKAEDKVAAAAPPDKARAEAELTTAKTGFTTVQVERDAAKAAVDEAEKTLVRLTAADGAKAEAVVVKLQKMLTIAVADKAKAEADLAASSVKVTETAAKLTAADAAKATAEADVAKAQKQITKLRASATTATAMARVAAQIKQLQDEKARAEADKASAEVGLISVQEDLRKAREAEAKAQADANTAKKLAEDAKKQLDALKAAASPPKPSI